MIDLERIKGTAVYFVILELVKLLEEQQKRIESLEKKKPGRPPKGGQ